MRDAIKHTDNLTLAFSDVVDAIPTFATKKAAVEAGRAFGWSDVIRIERRFEKVWAVGKRFLGEEEVAGIMRDEFRLPLLRWDQEGGVRRCPVLKVSRVVRAAAEVWAKGSEQ